VDGMGKQKAWMEICIGLNSTSELGLERQDEKLSIHSLIVTRIIRYLTIIREIPAAIVCSPASCAMTTRLLWKPPCKFTRPTKVPTTEQTDINVNANTKRLLV
jgi:hypothetical protein